MELKTMGKYTIEIDDELLHGKVPVAFRVPTEKDHWISPGGGIVNGGNAHCGYCPRLILEEPYTPPSWLKPGWIFPMSLDGGSMQLIEWYWSSVEPGSIEGGWTHSDVSVNLMYFNFTPPTQRRPYKVG